MICETFTSIHALGGIESFHFASVLILHRWAYLMFITLSTTEMSSWATYPLSFQDAHTWDCFKPFSTPSSPTSDSIEKSDVVGRLLVCYNNVVECALSAFGDHFVSGQALCNLLFWMVIFLCLAESIGKHSWMLGCTFPLFSSDLSLGFKIIVVQSRLGWPRG